MRRGVINFSVELDWASRQPARIKDGQLGMLASQLVELLDHYRAPATWALSEPATSPVCERILCSRGGHEIALLGDASWIGPDVARATTAYELNRRVRAARDAQLYVSSLVLRDTVLSNELDLILQCDLTAVSGAIAEKSRHSSPISACRIGVWYSAPQAILPHRIPRLPFIGAVHKARQAVRRTARSAATTNLAINAGQLLQLKRPGMRALESVLRRVDRWRRRRMLEVETLAETSLRHVRAFRSSPSRSILRSAA